MKTVNCEGVDYLAHESIGGAALWIRPTALHYCHGRGLDIGYSKPEWQLPGSIGVEPEIDKKYDAMHLPNNGLNNRQWDYIHSSHCLEHVKENWHNVLDYWLSALKVGGILFLYLPHASQNYWQPRNNRKHIHSFLGPEIDTYLKGLGHQVFVSGVDANHSFTVICEKKETRKTGWASVDSELMKDLPSLKDVLSMPDKSTKEDRDILFGNGNNPDIKFTIPDSKYVLHAHLNMTDEQHAQALKDGEALRKEFMNADFSKSEIKPIGKCEIHESRWFEQNTEDLANKIADMRMQSESHKTIEQKDKEKESLHAHVNIIRRLLDVAPFTIPEFLERVCK